MHFLLIRIFIFLYEHFTFSIRWIFYRYSCDIIRKRNCFIGKFTYGTPRISFAESNAVLRIGSFCSIAQDVHIMLGGEHFFHRVSTWPFSYAPKCFPARPKCQDACTKGDVNIGNDVWIGHGALILSGLHIGNGAVIGAHAVITKDVPPYAIMGGNPARILKYRFSEKQIFALERILWYEWSTEKINERLPLFYQDSPDAFIEAELGPGWQEKIQ